MDSTEKKSTNATEWEKEWEMDMDDQELIKIYEQLIGDECLAQSETGDGDREMNRDNDEATFEALLDEVLDL